MSLLDVGDPSRSAGPLDAAEPPDGPVRLIGRDSVIDQLSLADRLGRDATGVTPPLTVLAGGPGTGRSAVLDAVGAKLSDRGVRVVTARLSSHDQHTDYGVLYRLLTELVPHAGAGTGNTPHAVLGLVSKLSAGQSAPVTPNVRAQLAATVFSAARQYAPLAVLIDDVQWADAATVALLDQLVRQFSGQDCAVIATWRPARSAVPVTLDRLRADGLARLVALRPLSRSEIRTVVAESVRAIPDDELVDQVARSSHGAPSAVHTVIDAHRRSGALRIVDRHAYLAMTEDLPAVPGDHELMAPLRESGQRREALARAMSVLSAVGTSADSLAARAIEAEPDAVAAELDALVADRVLVHGPSGWRFRIPLLRDVLEAVLGPYERRRLSAMVAEAIMDNSVQPDDEHLLADRLAAAGRLVDPKHSADELLARGGELIFTDGARSVRWLRAVIDRVSDPEHQAMTLMAHSSACAIHNRMPEAVHSARRLLDDHADALSPEMLQELYSAYLAALSACGHRAELTRIADPEATPLPGTDAHRVVTRAFALILLGEWAAGAELLRRQRHRWADSNPVTVDFGQMFLAGSDVVHGDLRQLREFLAQPGRWRARNIPQHGFEQVRHEVNMLLLLGEMKPAQEHLRANSVDADQLTGPSQFVLAAHRGDHAEALDIARRTIAEGLHIARPLGPMTMLFGAARILAGKGWLNRARQMTALLRGKPGTYLLDHADSLVQRTVGDDRDADRLLRSGLSAALANGYVLGTEDMWAHLATREHQLGNVRQAKECVERTRELAESLNTGRAELMHLLSRMAVLGDRTSAREAVSLVRERDDPFESAMTFIRVAESGVDAEDLLSEAYELFGGIDALLMRARVRSLMRQHGISVPGRARATAENERLLAVLVTEGLSNRQLARVFGTSEKSVEGRLTRMFARIGYRSRVELAAAMLTGEYQG